MLKGLYKITRFEWKNICKNNDLFTRVWDDMTRQNKKAGKMCGNLLFFR